MRTRTTPTPTRTPTTPTTASTSVRGALERCVEPVEADEFLADHWERRPLVVDRDEPGRYDDLLSQHDVERAVTSGGLRYPGFRLVKAGEKLSVRDYARDVAWRPVPFTGSADVERVLAEWERGATIVLQGLHLTRPELGAFCRSLEAALGHPVQANAYYTPRRAQGLPVHHDTHDVFVLQLAGEKRWLVYEPALELPLRDQRYKPELGGPGAPVHDLVLRPGDTLYLPRGWLHEALTSDFDSLHLTVGVNVVTWLDAFRAALDECADDVEFRRSVDGGDGAGALLDALRSRLAPADVSRRARRKLVRSRRPIRTGQFDQLRALGGLDADTELERRPTVLVELEEGPDGVTLLFEQRELTVPAVAAEEVRAVVESQEPFTAAALPGSLDEEGRLVLVRRLVREGIILISGA